MSPFTQAKKVPSLWYIKGRAGFLFFVADGFGNPIKLDKAKFNTYAAQTH